MSFISPHLLFCSLSSNFDASIYLDVKDNKKVEKNIKKILFMVEWIKKTWRKRYEKIC